MVFKDPFVNHAKYCALSKDERRRVVHQLWLDISDEMFNNFSGGLPILVGLKDNWESMILACKVPEERNKIYSMILDAGVSFSDGTDGVWWGTCNGLRYHDQPVSIIAQARQRAGYHKKVTTEFEKELFEKPRSVKAKLDNQFNHQLERIDNRVKSQTRRVYPHKRRVRPQ